MKSLRQDASTGMPEWVWSVSGTGIRLFIDLTEDALFLIPAFEISISVNEMRPEKVFLQW